MEIDEKKIKQIVNQNEYFHDILDKVPSRIIRWSNTVFLFLFILLGIGLYFIKYPDIVISDVAITTETPPVEIYSRTQGRIIQFLKKDNDTVKTGDWVIILNNSANYLDIVNLNVALKKINSNNFWDSINETEFKDSYILGDIQNTYFNFLKSINEFKLFNELNSQYRQLNINLNRVDNLNTLKNKLENQLQNLENQLLIIKGDYERNLKLHSEGVIAKIELEKKEIEYLNIKDRVEGLKGNVLNAQLQKEQIEKENVSLDIEKNETYFRLRSNILQYNNNLLFELEEWKNKFVIDCPIDGVINFYEIRRKEQFIAEQKKAFTITPINLKQNYFALLKLPISNSGKVRVGQKCIIKLHNFPYAEFGYLEGTISSISLATNDNMYSAKVELPKQLRTNVNKQLFTKSELIGKAEIIINDLTLLDRIFNVLTSKTN